MVYKSDLKGLQNRKQHRQNHLLKHIALSLVFIVLLSGFLRTVFNVNAASSPWTQTDWVGGLGSSTSNQYSSVSQLNTGVAGEIQLNDSTKMNWMDPAWGYRRKVTFDNRSVFLGTTSETLTNFPVLIKLTNGVNIDYSKTRDMGEDIRFTDSDGTTLLSYEIDYWTESADSYIWVKVPQIDIDSNTDYIYLYYGNTSANDAQNKTAVWSPIFAGVWHLTESAGNHVAGLLDSSSNNNPGTPSGFNLDSDSNTGQTGIIGKAPHFDGTDSVISMGDPANGSLDMGDGEYSLMYWFKRDLIFSSSGERNRNIVSKMNTSTVGVRTILKEGNGWDHIFSYSRDASNLQSAYVPSGANLNWNYFAMTFDTSNVIRTYLNGGAGFAQSGTATINSIDNNGSFELASTINCTLAVCFDGYIDEVRLSKQLLSRAWFAADYKNQYSTFSTYGSEEFIYNTGNLTSNIFDTEQISSWGNLIYSTNGLGTYAVRVRTGNQPDLSDASSFNTCNPITSGTDISTNNCVSDNRRYVQYQITISITTTVLPVLQDISIQFALAETVPPEVNATDVGITGVNTGSWINYEPTISWEEGSDNLGGSGILGYCIALDETNLDTTNTLNPAITAGKLNGYDDGVLNTYCPYIATGDNINLSALTSFSLVVGKQYNVSLRAVDGAGNFYPVTNPETYQDLFSFKYDNVSPSNPSYITLPANFVSSKDVTMTWPTGAGAATDNVSQVAGLQYKIGDSGIWYGDLHNGSQNNTDLLANDGSYTFNETYDYNELNEGVNNIYVRTWDNAGNISTSLLTGVLKLNSSSPSTPQNLSVTPTTNTTNSYSFDWDEPATFTGQASGITYCYTVNALPDNDTCTFTQPGVTSLSADGYATKPGTNTFYVVAKDEAGNINFATKATVEFTYSGSAPGIPRNLDLGDLSIKSTSSWKLALSWDSPLDEGAGISKYRIYRSNVNSSCSSSFESFTEIANLNGNSYVDSGLTQQTYNYCVKACDSANACSAVSSTVSGYPDGKYTDPALLLGDVKISSVTTKRATIEWVTDRLSDSKISYGLVSGQYYPEEIGSSTQELSHSITLNNLKAGTTYYIVAKWTDEDGNTGVSSEKSFTTSAPPKVKEVITDNLSVSSALIKFTSSNAYKARIYYGESDALTRFEEVNISPTETNYTVPIVELKDDTKHYFRINLIDLEGEEYNGDIYSFNTLPKPRVSNIQVEEIKNSAQPTIKVDWTSNADISSIISYYPESNEAFKRDAVDLELKQIHSLTISNLSANTRYVLIVRGIDKIGNEAISDKYFVSTSTDSRPPLISNLRIETTLTNTVEDKNAQIIISWQTDELATSRVEFGDGINANYDQSSPEDKNLKFDHLVIISNLVPSKVYSLRAISVDSSGNLGKSTDTVTITPAKTDSALDLVIKNLVKVFDFL